MFFAGVVGAGRLLPDFCDTLLSVLHSTCIPPDQTEGYFWLPEQPTDPRKQGVSVVPTRCHNGTDGLRIQSRKGCRFKSCLSHSAAVKVSRNAAVLTQPGVSRASRRHPGSAHSPAVSSSPAAVKHSR